MINRRRKGYRVERKIRIIFEKNGWKVVRSGASLGESDLICLKNGDCILLQVKSTLKPKLYYYGYMEDTYEEFPFYLVIDFGRGNIRVARPTDIIENNEGIPLDEFLVGIPP